MSPPQLSRHNPVLYCAFGGNILVLSPIYVYLHGKGLIVQSNVIKWVLGFLVIVEEKMISGKCEIEGFGNITSLPKRPPSVGSKGKQSSWGSVAC